MPDSIALRPLDRDDAPLMVHVLDDPELYRFTGGAPPTEEQLARRYGVQVRGHSADGSEEWLNRIVLAGSEPVGYVQATIPRSGGPTEVAWVIGTSWQGRGYASAAMAAFLRELAQRGVDRLIAHIHPDHEASSRIAARIGLAPTATLVDGELRWAGGLKTP